MALGKPNLALHNRLTHSLKVDQVGASLMTRLTARGELSSTTTDAFAVSTACLAHDIGHPPFGHAGEIALHEMVVCKEHRSAPRPLELRRNDPCEHCLLEDGFEGNAQTFRVLAVLSAHEESRDQPYGLDLTRASLRAVSKYPWTRGADGRKPAKWGAYDCDADILQWVVGGYSANPSLDAQIMDWADDVSYAVHDIEDFFRAGLIPLDDYKPNSETLKIFMAYVESPHALGSLSDDVKSALEGMLEFFPYARYSDRSTDRASVDTLRRRLVTQFIDAAAVIGDDLITDSLQQQLNQIVKQFIWFHIIDDPRLANIQRGQQRILREIFESLHEVADHAYRASASPSEQELRRLPHALRRSIEIALSQSYAGYTLKQSIARGLLDYVSGLSDAEAYQVHAVLKGREAAGYL